MTPDNTPVICLMGPTATGKTDAAAALSSALNGEIVSVDSSLVYRGMDIGTAKPKPEFLRCYPHHLVDVRDPNDTYSVADFYRDGSALIEQICTRGKLPILVGGTHFYFRALEHGLADLPQADAALRDKITAQAAVEGWPALHSKLQALDPQRAAAIEPKDAQRIQRALEIVLQSGQVVAAHEVGNKRPMRRPLVKIALVFSNREVLHQRIEQRFDQMLAEGLEQEVTRLLEQGVDPQAPAMKMIGYRQMLEYLQGVTTYHDMRAKGIAATRQLAKRQLTWLRNQSNVLWWVDFGLKEKKFDQLLHYVKQIVQNR